MNLSSKMEWWDDLRAEIEKERGTLDPELLSSPNGINGEKQPSDYLSELLPLLSKAEAERAKRNTPEQIKGRQRLSALSNEHLSMFRHCPENARLKPFRLRNERLKTCTTCDGEGLVTCKYCDNNGYIGVETCGPPGSEIVFEGERRTVPPKGDIEDGYICPFCNGTCQVECRDCDGDGSTLEGSDQDASPGAASWQADEVAYRGATLRDWIAENEGKYDIGKDGTVIFRSRRRPRRKKRATTKAKAEKDAPDNASPSNDSEKPKRRRRGRPRKGQTLEDLYPMKMPESLPRQTQPSVPSPGQLNTGRATTGPGRAQIGRTTDFINTTALQLRARMREAGGWRKSSENFIADLNEEIARSGDGGDSDTQLPPASDKTKSD